MANSLSPIPVGTPIVYPASGAINLFFRQLWEGVRLALGLVPTVGAGYDATNQDGTAGSPTIVYTVTTGGRYRVSYYIRKTVADGVTSSIQFTWNWVENGVAQSLADAALTTDTTGAVASGSKMLFVDANSQLSFSRTYASNTANKMKYLISVRVEQLN